MSAQQPASLFGRAGMPAPRGQTWLISSRVAQEPFREPRGNERLARRLGERRDDPFTFPRQPGLDATHWRAEPAIRFGVIPRKVSRGSRTRAGAVRLDVGVADVLAAGRSALGFRGQLLRGAPAPLALLS